MDSYKRFLLDKLAEQPMEVIQLAYVYAINVKRHGVDVTKAWETAVEQSNALQSAYCKGANDCFNNIKGEKENDKSIEKEEQS